MNERLAIQKGLIVNGSNNIYLNIQTIYKYFFEKYLLTKVDISYYNDLIKSSNLYFGEPHPNQEELVTNLNEYFNFEYIYLINNFYVEKLSTEQINLLIDSSKNNNFEFTDEIKDMIESTYKEIIRKNFFKGHYVDERYEVCYGIPNEDNFAYNDDIVLKIFYSRNTKQMTDSEFLENLKAKEEFLNNLTNLIKKEFLEKLNVGCSVLIEKINR